MSQAAGRSPLLLIGAVVVFVIVLGLGGYALNNAVNPPPAVNASPTPVANACPTAPSGHPAKNPTRTYSQAPTNTLDPTKTYVAGLCTTRGFIVVRLRADTNPITVNNFVFLANAGFYDGLLFHRVCPSGGAALSCSGTSFAIAQGGDPTGNGSGGPGYSLPDEGANGPYGIGTVAMAKSTAISGSQFFIDITDNSFLTTTGPYNLLGDITTQQSFTVATNLRPGDRILWVAVQAQVTPTPSPSAAASPAPLGSAAPASPTPAPTVSASPSP